MAETAIDEALRVAREVQPDLWERTDAVARIIAPEAFEEGWTIITPAGAQELHDARLRYMQAAARSKAQAVLKFLGVNTDTDWYEILDRMARQAVAKDGRGKVRPQRTVARRAGNQKTTRRSTPDGGKGKD